MALTNAPKKCARFSQRTSSQSCSLSFILRSAVMASAVGVKECACDSVLKSWRAIIRSSPTRFLKSSTPMHSAGVSVGFMLTVGFWKEGIRNTRRKAHAFHLSQYSADAGGALGKRHFADCFMFFRRLNWKWPAQGWAAEGVEGGGRCGVLLLGAIGGGAGSEAAEK